MTRRLIPLLVTTILLAACANGFFRSGAPVMDPGMMDRHMAPIPPDYAGLSNPVPADAETLARGQAVYAENCATCHGESGWGDGPAANGLNPPPAPLAHTAAMLSDAYLFYRVSEGGGFSPFNSAMPAWKDKLSETERWEVIHYIRGLSAGSMDTMMSGGSPMGGLGTGMMGWIWLVWLGAAVLLVMLIIVGLWALRRPAAGGSAGDNPLAILKRRYARGEISFEQFEAMKQKLKEE